MISQICKLIDKINAYEKFMESLEVPICIKNEDDSIIFQNSKFKNQEAKIIFNNELNTKGDKSLNYLSEKVLGKRSRSSLITPPYEGDDDGILCNGKSSNKRNCLQTHSDLTTFKELLNYLPIIIVLTLENGRAFFCNKKWEEYTGSKSKATINNAISHFFYPEQEVTEKIFDFITDEQKEFDLEMQLRKHDGTICWFKMVSKMVLLNDENIRICSFINIDEEKQSLSKIESLEVELEEERQLFDAVLESVPLAVIIAKAPGGELIKYTKKMTEIWGNLPLEPFKVNAELYSVFKGFYPDGRCYGSKDWPISRSLFFKEYVYGEMIQFKRFDQSDEKRLFLRVHSAPVCDKNGKVLAAIGISEDVTEIEKMREEKIQLLSREQSALESSRIKSEFLANMSHEIRTPLNGVLGMAELLLNTNLNLEQNEYVEAIKNSGQLLLGIINDILDFSKIEAGKMVIKKASFSFAELVQHVECIMKPSAVVKNLDFSIEIDKKLPTEFIGDSKKIKQVLINLVNNSIKFTNEGFVRVEISGHSISELLFKLKVKVIDSGIGIPQHVLPLLFQPFTQADSSNTRSHGGTGLGLSICKKMIDLMGGKVSVKSVSQDEVADNHGSCFEFSIDLEVPSNSSFKQTSVSGNHISEPIFQPKEKCLLIAEDNIINQKFLLKILNLLGYEKLHCVSDGKQALETYKQNPKLFDIILMDCQMPLMDGFESTIKIREFEEENQLSNVPIIAVTASALLSDQQKCKESGMNDHIAKPFTKLELSNKLNQWLTLPMNLENKL